MTLGRSFGGLATAEVADQGPIGEVPGDGMAADDVGRDLVDVERASFRNLAACAQAPTGGKADADFVFGFDARLEEGADSAAVRAAVGAGGVGTGAAGDVGGIDR